MVENYRAIVYQNIVSSRKLSLDLAFLIDENYGTSFWVDYETERSDDELKSLLIEIHKTKDKDRSLIKKMFALAQERYPYAIKYLKLDPNIIYVNSKQVFDDERRYKLDTFLRKNLRLQRKYKFCEKLTNAMEHEWSCGLNDNLWYIPLDEILDYRYKRLWYDLA